MESGVRSVKRNAKVGSARLAEPAARLPEGMAGLAKGLAIIEAFEPAGGKLTVSDAARQAGIPRATARRCLLTLVDLQYVAHDGKFFTPLPRLVRLGAAYLRAAPPAARAQSILAAARDRLGESVSLAVLQGTDAVFTARAEAEHIVSTGVRVGARLPAYCSATGRVLLAALGPEAAATLLATAARPRRTPKTIVEPAAIVAALRRVAADGYALSDEELTLGMRSIAVPVRNADGSVIAAMSASVSSARLGSAEFVARALPVLRDHAQLLEQSLPGGQDFARIVNDAPTGGPSER